MSEQKVVHETETLRIPLQTNVFDKYIASDAIFKSDREMLRPSYIPKVLPHREKEIDQLAAIVSTGLRGDRPSNVLIFGKTGTGKTATVKFIANEASRVSTASTSIDYHGEKEHLGLRRERLDSFGDGVKLDLVFYQNNIPDVQDPEVCDRRAVLHAV